MTASNEARAGHGHAAMTSSPDYGQNDLRTNAIDTIANILHATADDVDDAGRIVNEAVGHWIAERSD